MYPKDPLSTKATKKTPYLGLILQLGKYMKLCPEYAECLTRGSMIEYNTQAFYYGQTLDNALEIDPLDGNEAKEKSSVHMEQESCIALLHFSFSSQRKSRINSIKWHITIS